MKFVLKKELSNFELNVCLFFFLFFLFDFRQIKQYIYKVKFKYYQNDIYK